MIVPPSAGGSTISVVQQRRRGGPTPPDTEDKLDVEGGGAWAEGGRGARDGYQTDGDTVSGLE